MKAALAVSLLLVAVSSCCVEAQSTQPYVIQFPRDLYDHPSFQTEWWYFTGNLESRQGKQYGFELTFFRSYEATNGQLIPIIFADLGVSDISGQHFYFYKSVAPETPPLASITENPWTIQLGAWELTEPASEWGVFHLKATQDNFGVDLALRPEGPPVLHGRDGLFELAGSDGQGKEYYEYYSIPRMRAEGSIEVDGESIPIHGLAWNDHEFFNLASGQTFPSWDWFSIQLDDGSSLMLYGLRLPNGKYDPDSRGTFIARDGRVTHLGPGSFTLVPGETWHSAVTDANYPIAWTICIPSLSIQLDMSTPLLDQEMPAVPTGASPSYWEGASRFRGTREGRFVEGKGYTELLGYAPK
jgi:predicted secreted hydrolase